jgi:hypothetical protein
VEDTESSSSTHPALAMIAAQTSISGNDSPVTEEDSQTDNTTINPDESSPAAGIPEQDEKFPDLNFGPSRAHNAPKDGMDSIKETIQTVQDWITEQFDFGDTLSMIFSILALLISAVIILRNKCTRNCCKRNSTEQSRVQRLNRWAQRFNQQNRDLPLVPVNVAQAVRPVINAGQSSRSAPEPRVPAQSTSQEHDDRLQQALTALLSTGHTLQFRNYQ